MDGWTDDWSSVGWHEDCEQTYDTSVRSVPCGGLDVSAWRGPKRFELVKMNLETGGTVNTFPVNFSPEGIGDEGFYDWIPDGEASQFQGYENGLHQVLCSAAEIACEDQ